MLASHLDEGNFEAAEVGDDLGVEFSGEVRTKASKPGHFSVSTNLVTNFIELCECKSRLSSHRITEARKFY